MPPETEPDGGRRQGAVSRYAGKQSPTSPAGGRRSRSRSGTGFGLPTELSVIMRALTKPHQSSYRCDDFKGFLFFIPKEAAEYCTLDPPDRSAVLGGCKDPEKLSLWSDSASCSRRPSVSTMADSQVGRGREQGRRDGTPGCELRPEGEGHAFVRGSHPVTADGAAASHEKEPGAAVDDFIPCLFYRWPTSDKLLVHVHGLHEDLGMVAPLLQTFHQRLRINVIAMEFPGYGVCSPAPHAEPSSPNSSGQNLEARPATVTSSSVLPEVWLPGVTAADPFASVDETRGAVPDCQREHQTQQSISSPVPVSAEHAEDSLSVVSLAKGASSKAASGSDDIEEEKESLLKFLVNLRVLLAFVLQRLRVPPQSVYLSANKLAAGPIIELCSFSDLMLGGDVSFGGLILFQPLFVPDISSSNSAFQSAAMSLRQSFSLPFRFAFGACEKDSGARQVSPPVQNFTLATFRMSPETGQASEQCGDLQGGEDKSCHGLQAGVTPAPEAAAHLSQTLMPGDQMCSRSDSSVGPGRDSRVLEVDVGSDSGSCEGRGVKGSSVCPGYLRRRASCSSSSHSTLSHKGGKFMLSNPGKPRVPVASTPAPARQAQDVETAQQPTSGSCLLKDQLHTHCLSLDAASTLNPKLESLSAGTRFGQDEVCDRVAPPRGSEQVSEGQQLASPAELALPGREQNSNCRSEAVSTCSSKPAERVPPDAGGRGESESPAAGRLSLRGRTFSRNTDTTAAAASPPGSTQGGRDPESRASKDGEPGRKDTRQDRSTIRTEEVSPGDRTSVLEEDSEGEAEGPLGIFSRLRSSMTSTFLGEDTEAGVLGAQLPLFSQIRHFLSRSFDPSPEPEEGGRTAAIVQAAIERKKRLLLENQKKICRQLPAAFTANQVVPHIREVTCPLLCMRRRARPRGKYAGEKLVFSQAASRDGSASTNEESSSDSVSSGTSSKTPTSVDSGAEEASLSDDPSSTSPSSRSSRTSVDEGSRQKAEGLDSPEAQDPDKNKRFEAMTKPCRESVARSIPPCQQDRKYGGTAGAARSRQSGGLMQRSQAARCRAYPSLKARKKQDKQGRRRAKEHVSLVEREAEEEETSVGLAVDVLMAEAGSSKKETAAFDKYDADFYRILDNFFWADGPDAAGVGDGNAVLRPQTSPRSIAERLSVQTAPRLTQTRRVSASRKRESLIGGICVPLCMFEVPAAYRRREAMLKEEEDGDGEGISWLDRAFSAYASYFNLLVPVGGSE